MLVTAPVLAVMLDWLVLGTRLHGALRGLPLLLCLPLNSRDGDGGGMGSEMMGWSLERAFNLVNLRDRPVVALAVCDHGWTVMIEYVRLLLWPAGQNLDRCGRCMTPSLLHGCSDPAAVLVAVVAGA